MGDYHWAIGVILASLASLISNLGLNFQKLTHLQNESQPESVRKEYYKNTLWIVGLIMIILGSVADFAALAFGAQSIIAPLGSLTLVSNVFFAPCLLGEKLTTRELLATGSIITGATIAVIFASHKDTIYGLDTLFGFYEQPRFGLYAIFILVVIGVLWSSIQYMDNLRKEGKDTPQYRSVIQYHRFCYAALAGTIGAQSVLFAKCSAELVVNTLIGQGFLFSYYQTWMVLICLFTTMILQIKWLNQGLQRFEALYIVPVFQSFWVLISVISGLIFFGEYAEMNSTQCLMFPVGVLFTITGVYYLSQRGVEDEDDNKTTSGDGSGSGGGGGGGGGVVGGGSGSVRTPPLSPRLTDDVPVDARPSELDIEQHHHDVHQRLIATDSHQHHPPSDSTPSAGAAHHHHKHHKRIIDESVGFGGHQAPASFLPSRALATSTYMRQRGPADRDPYKDDDDGMDGNDDYEDGL